jgi:hypothetical protein
MGRRLIALALAALVAAPVHGDEGADPAWPDLAGCFRQLHGKVGPIRVYRLEMDRDGVAELWIQDPARPDLVDRYPCANGTLGAATPVKFREYPTVAALDHHVIDPAAIDFARLPGMLASARAKLGLVDARVVTIRLERGDSGGAPTWSGIPIWTFDVETPRHDGRVEFNLQGTVLDVDKD